MQLSHRILKVFISWIWLKNYVITNGFDGCVPIFGSSPAREWCHVSGCLPKTTHFYWAVCHEIPPNELIPLLKTITNSPTIKQPGYCCHTTGRTDNITWAAHSFVLADAGGMVLFKIYRAEEVGLETQCTFKLAFVSRSHDIISST